MDGVTVAICCHNSARFLPETLDCLSRQSVSDGVPWEVLVIDNNSTDDTGDVARASWSSASVPLRVVEEPRIGLSNARKRALREARYEIVSFVDDDNRVEPDWVQHAWEVMGEHPDVGACGGQSVPDYEVEPPSWFAQYVTGFALGPPPAAEAGEITDKKGFLWGAGLTIRQSAWEDLLDHGFRFLLEGRIGKSLSSGEDRELCSALRARGWRLWYEPSLILRHHLPKERLGWPYIRRLHRGFGASTVIFDAYFMDKGGRLNTSWQWQVMLLLTKLSVRSVLLVPDLLRGQEGSRRLLRVEAQIGRLQALLKTRELYRKNRILVDDLRRGARFDGDEPLPKRQGDRPIAVGERP